MAETDGMKKYWDQAASGSKVNWHIAHIDDEEDFFASGWTEIAKIFPDGLGVIPQGANVLDLGCGKGRISRAIAIERPDVRMFGVDVSEKMISLAHVHCKDIKNLTYVVGDGTSLGVFPADMFDFVFSYVVFQHLPRDVTQRYVEEVGRVLRPGGSFTFQLQSMPQPQEIDPRWNDYRKIRYYTPNQAALLVADPLKLTGTRGAGHDFFVQARKDVSSAHPRPIPRVSSATASARSECPVCASTEGFAEFRGRPAEKCAKCGSLARQRVMYLCLHRLGRLPEQRPQDRRRVAHFAPERSLFRALSMRGRNEGYKAFDLFPDKYEFAKGRIAKCDICTIDEALAPGSFDLVVHNHVLEHLSCPVPKAIASIHRLLSADGFHAFTIPMRRGRFDEDLSPSLSDKDRKARFAQEDHVRIFGKEDAEEMFREILGRKDVVLRLSDFLSREDAVRFGVAGPYDIDAAGKVGGHSVFFFDPVK